MNSCDLCDQEIEPGQPRFAGRGTGGRDGAPLGKSRHWSCHVERFGRPPALSSLLTPPAPATIPAREVKVPPRRRGPINYSDNARRDWRHTGRTISEMGRRRIEIECPFCFAQFWAFVWSLAGGGKRCTNCGAMHMSGGIASPIEGNEEL